MQSGERYAKEKNMKVLTEISPDDDAESAVKHTVLHVAAECTSEDIAKYLVKGIRHMTLRRKISFFRMLIF